MWANPQENADLVTFTEEIVNEKLHFCVVYFKENYAYIIKPWIIYTRRLIIKKKGNIWFFKPFRFKIR